MGGARGTRGAQSAPAARGPCFPARGQTVLRTYYGGDESCQAVSGVFAAKRSCYATNGRLWQASIWRSFTPLTQGIYVQYSPWNYSALHARSCDSQVTAAYDDSFRGPPRASTVTLSSWSFPLAAPGAYRVTFAPWYVPRRLSQSRRAQPISAACRLCALLNSQVGQLLDAKMGHNDVWNSHPKNYGQGSRHW